MNYSLNLLLFSVGGVSFAADAEQIEGISGYDRDESDDLVWFHEISGFGHKQLIYRAPTVISARIADNRSLKIIIDNMEDIAEYSTEAIVPLPELIEPFAVKNGIWGVLKNDDNMTMLVDFYRIAPLQK